MSVSRAGRRELYDAGYTLYDLQGRRLAVDSRLVYHCLALPPGLTWTGETGVSK